MAFQHKRLREVPLNGGASAFREGVPLDPQMYDYSARLLQALNWTGLAMVEFKVGASGPKLMEINGRVWGSLPLAIRSGVDFPVGLAVLYLYGPPRNGAAPETHYQVGVPGAQSGTRYGMDRLCVARQTALSVSQAAFDTAGMGLTDPEGVEFNYDTGNLFIVSRGEDMVVETTRDGTVVSVINFPVPIDKPAGLAYGPRSNNPAEKSLYIVDRAVDNDSNPNENDGKMYEITVGQPATTPTPSPTPTMTFTPTPTNTPTHTNTPNPNVTPTNTPTNTATPTPTNTPTPTPPPSANPLFLSLASGGTVGGVAAADEDILRFDGVTWSLFFDGSDIGVGSVDVFAFYIVDAGPVLMSFDKAITIGNLPAALGDIVQFDATSLGDNTAGSFSLYFDGDDVGLTTTSGPIDALEVLPDGRILISTAGNPSVPGVSGEDEDILAFTPTTLGDTTSGAWAMYFDGSDVGLADSSSEDIDALDVAPNGDIYLSASGNFAVNGVSGADEDIFICTPTSLGDVTTCNYSPVLYFDGSTWGLDANDVDGVSLP